MGCYIVPPKSAHSRYLAYLFPVPCECALAYPLSRGTLIYNVLFGLSPHPYITLAFFHLRCCVFDMINRERSTTLYTHTSVPCCLTLHVCPPCRYFTSHTPIICRVRPLRWLLLCVHSSVSSSLRTLSRACDERLRGVRYSHPHFILGLAPNSDTNSAIL